MMSDDKKDTPKKVMAPALTPDPEIRQIHILKADTKKGLRENKE